MGGFVWNNGMREVMSTFTPQDLQVLNGLAKAFAVSDEWFCSMPGATDSQRAFAATGSALQQLNNFMNGPKYNNWPDNPNRASIWKVLWANGFTDWKIYNSVLWPPSSPALPPRFVLTYHLFLEKQIPTVDDAVSAYLAGSAETSKYIGTINQFIDDARNGTLPAFSFIEPLWIGGGPGEEATSYHPYGDGGIQPGEEGVKRIYEALKAGPKWDETLLIVTFDEHGGFFDHVPPPYAENPWPNDENDGFRYDLMGVRVPTILVSPWIKQQTVFRSSTEVAYDSTSILATLLQWYGIPKARWAMGARAHHAPTFEGVFQCGAARKDKPSFQPPTLKVLEREDSRGLTELHELMVPRMVHAMVGGRLGTDETVKIAEDILARASDVETLNRLLKELGDELGETFANTKPSMLRRES
jgi:phospholipase C